MILHLGAEAYTKVIFVVCCNLHVFFGSVETGWKPSPEDSRFVLLFFSSCHWLFSHSKHNDLDKDPEKLSVVLRNVLNQVKVLVI